MQEILLVNPARRPSKRRKSTKRASPAQLRARAKFAAAARARSKKGAAVMSNPKRRTRRAKRSVAVRHRNPIRHANPKRRTHRRRRNPIGGDLRATSLLKGALVGALGATAVNTVLGQVSGMLPATLTTGNMAYLTRLGAALGLAALAGKMGAKRAMVAQMAEGSMTVTLHDAIVSLSGGMGMQLGGMRGLGVYMPGRGAQAVPHASGNPARLAGMGAYMTGKGAPGVALPVRTGGMRGFNR